MGLGKRRSRSVERRFVTRRINLVQRSAGSHGRSFHEEPPLDDPAHLGAEFGDAIRRGPAGQFGRQGDRLRPHDVDDDLRRGRCVVGRGRFRAVARG